jgi:hypothetical protein
MTVAKHEIWFVFVEGGAAAVNQQDPRLLVVLESVKRRCRVVTLIDLLVVRFGWIMWS